MEAFENGSSDWFDRVCDGARALPTLLPRAVGKDAKINTRQLVTGQGVIPPDLAAMADTERQFAKTATSKGWRDAFLDFFADDAVALGREVTLAKDGLRKQPSTPFSQLELVWEPRLGDVAASGDLGWLTGPSTSINHTSKEPKPNHGCYLSIWRKQPDGKWRVFIDVGAGAPEPVPFATGFIRMPFGSRYAGKEGKDAAGKSLAQADRDLNAQMASPAACPPLPGSTGPGTLRSSAPRPSLRGSRSMRPRPRPGTAPPKRRPPETSAIPTAPSRSRRPSRSLALISGFGTATHRAAGG